jgi:sugar/nucleoside kinase (ribokinase family)
MAAGRAPVNKGFLFHERRNYITFLLIDTVNAIDGSLHGNSFLRYTISVMKKILVIGSTVVDVLLNLPQLPRRGEDINIVSSNLHLGGCAWNTACMLNLFGIPHILCSPVGTGIYGDFVRRRFAAEGLKPFVNLEEENGCCYCLIEADGERTFLSHHGAEYRFSKEWMAGMDFSDVDSIFICGLEVEDSDGAKLIDFVCEHTELTLYFAPGPRIMHIAPDRMKRLLACRPVLHLNEKEACVYTGIADNVPAVAVRPAARPAAGQQIKSSPIPLRFIEKAADMLAEKTGGPLIITMGEQGCYYREAGAAQGYFTEAVPAQVVDTVGTGDAHCGALIACLKKGQSLKEAAETANKAGAAVAGIAGAELDEEKFKTMAIG